MIALDGRKVCNVLATGGSQQDAYRQTLSYTGWDQKSASLFVGMAVGSYCPQYAS